MERQNGILPNVCPDAAIALKIRAKFQPESFLECQLE
jgi:hypothetical protein